jgi:[ribosomal protein S18]-alanine N-acetyltransferase
VSRGQPDYRPMTAEDLPAVTALAATLQAFPWSLGNFADSLAQGHAAEVCWLGEERVGFAVCMPALDEVHLLDIGVARGHQGLGLGAGLLQRAIDRSRNEGATRMLLEVRAANTQAIDFYRRFGFAQIGLRRGYYPATVGREDALVFDKDLR